MIGIAVYFAALFLLLVCLIAIPYWSYRAVISLPFVAKLIRSNATKAPDGRRGGQEKC
jgi:hypothetical protein